MCASGFMNLPKCLAQPLTFYHESRKKQEEEEIILIVTFLLEEKKHKAKSNDFSVSSIYTSYI